MSKRQAALPDRGPTGGNYQENQIDRRTDEDLEDLMERRRVERSREQVVAVSGRDHQEYMVACGFRLLETSCLAQEQVDR
jgi:hypothetical protein